MSKICELTGKKPITGHNVSHSNRKTKRWFRPNIQTKRFYIPEEDRWVRLKISMAALRTIDKKGIYEYLKEVEKKTGKKYLQS
ncbi:MAG: 50S ribosomal protein L28 [Chitinophagales bacterium]